MAKYEIKYDGTVKQSLYDFEQKKYIITEEQLAQIICQTHNHKGSMVDWFPIQDSFIRTLEPYKEPVKESQRDANVRQADALEGIAGTLDSMRRSHEAISRMNDLIYQVDSGEITPEEAMKIVMENDAEFKKFTQSRRDEVL